MGIFGKPDIQKLLANHDVEGLIKALTNKEDSVRIKASEALELIHDIRSIGPLIAAFKDTHPSVPFNASDALRYIGNPAVEPLIAALKNTDENMRYWAATTLQKINDPRSVDPLIVALNDYSIKVRKAATEALVKRAPEITIEPLIAFLKDDDRIIRLWSIGLLEKLGDRRAIDPLIASLKDPDALVRHNAAGALREFPDPRAVKPLIVILNDPDDNVANISIYALAKIGLPAVKPLLVTVKDEDNGYFVRLRALRALVAIGLPAKESVIAEIKNGNQFVRSQIMKLTESHDLMEFLYFLLNENVLSLNEVYKIALKLKKADFIPEEKIKLFDVIQELIEMLKSTTAYTQETPGDDDMVVRTYENIDYEDLSEAIKYLIKVDLH